MLCQPGGMEAIMRIVPPLLLLFLHGESLHSVKKEEFGAMDKDRDGVVDMKEWVTTAYVNFDTMDRNGDRKISKAEWVAFDFVAGHQSFDRTDLSHDGLVDFKELTMDLVVSFNLKDINYDGILDYEELNTPTPKFDSAENLFSCVYKSTKPDDSIMSLANTVSNYTEWHVAPLAPEPSLLPKDEPEELKEARKNVLDSAGKIPSAVLQPVYYQQFPQSGGVKVHISQPHEFKSAAPTKQHPITLQARAVPVLRSAHARDQATGLAAGSTAYVRQPAPAVAPNPAATNHAQSWPAAQTLRFYPRTFQLPVPSTSATSARNPASASQLQPQQWSFVSKDFNTEKWPSSADWKQNEWSQFARWPKRRA